MTVHLTINLYFGMQTSDINANTSTEFVKKLREKHHLAYRMAHAVVMENQYHKHSFDHKLTCTCLKNGDSVHHNLVLPTGTNTETSGNEGD